MGLWDFLGFITMNSCDKNFFISVGTTCLVACENGLLLGTPGPRRLNLLHICIFSGGVGAVRTSSDVNQALRDDVQNARCMFLMIAVSRE